MTWLSVVIPAYNESERLPATLERINHYLKGREGAWEVIVVDDGSSDGTAEVAREYGVRVIACSENRGKGAAVRTGVAASVGRLVLISDADLATPIEALELLEAHSDDAPFVYGSRAVDASDIRERQPWYRESLGKTFNKIIQALGVSEIRDTQCGFKLLDGDLAREIFSWMKIDGFAYDVEFTWLAQRSGCQIAEIGVPWQHVEASRVHLVVDPIKMFWDVVRMRLLHRKLPQLLETQRRSSPAG